jgi:hypothetical protein
MLMKQLKLAPALLLVLVACTGFPLFWKKEPQPGAERAGDARSEEASPHVMLEVDEIRYDGALLSGRLMIGAESGAVHLDKRLVSRADVHVNSVLECSSGAPVAFIMADVLPSPARQEDLLILAPGYWYGTTVRFKLFSERFTGLGPECIEAQLTVFSFEGKALASSRIRAERIVTATDGGIPRGAPAAADAGSP